MKLYGAWQPYQSGKCFTSLKCTPLLWSRFRVEQSGGLSPPIRSPQQQMDRTQRRTGEDELPSCSQRGRGRLFLSENESYLITVLLTGAADGDGMVLRNLLKDTLKEREKKKKQQQQRVQFVNAWANHFNVGCLATLVNIVKAPQNSRFCGSTLTAD